MQRRTAIALLAASVWRPAPARTTPVALSTALPGARLQGSARMRFFGLHVYDIRLWAGETEVTPADWASVPLALEIEYTRALVGRKIAERSLAEMRRQAQVDAATGQHWLDEMSALFPDVTEGDRLTGVQHPGAGASFFFNDRPHGEIRDAAFTRLFFGIWLSQRTSEPALRDALLGPAGGKR
jgi:hypothetical protein